MTTPTKPINLADARPELDLEKEMRKRIAALKRGQAYRIRDLAEEFGTSRSRLRRVCSEAGVVRLVKFVNYRALVVMRSDEPDPSTEPAK